MNNDLLAAVLARVHVEATNAMRKFDPFNSAHQGKAVIEEELDELWEHVKANTGRSEAAMREAIQVAAMAVRYVYDLEDKLGDVRPGIGRNAHVPRVDR